MVSDSGDIDAFRPRMREAVLGSAVQVVGRVAPWWEQPALAVESISRVVGARQAGEHDRDHGKPRAHAY